MNQSDYLDSTFREKVERLKSEVSSTPTSPENLRDRAEILWEWANRFSVTGVPLPVDCSFFMASVFVGNDVGEFSVLRRDPKISAIDLDQMLAELSLKERHLGAFGEIVIASSDSLLAESHQVLKQRFVVGEVPLSEGAGLLIARNGFVDHGIPQQSDPTGENYVTIECDNPRAVFTPDSIEMRGLRGGIRTPIPVLLFRLSGTQLRQGESVTITYGDQSKGGKGFRIQSTSTDSFKLPIYVDFFGDDNFITFDYPSFEIQGNASIGLHGFVPSIVEVNQSFEIAIRFEDKARNRATGAIPGFQVYLGVDLVASIASGNEAIHKISNLSISEAGTHRFRIVSDSGISTWSDPIWVRTAPAERIFWGDLHGHCEFADGQGSPDGFFKFGRDDAQLDFLCLSEHDVFLDDNKWKYLQDCLVRYELPGKFIPMLAYEWTAPPKLGGHHNVYFRRGDSEIVGLHRANNLENLWSILKELNDKNDVLVIPHAHQVGDWRRADREIVAGVEITSQHGSFEWLGQRYLESGLHIGFVGGSDNHQGHPGYSSTSASIGESLNGLTAAWANELESGEIFNAIQNRSVYATTGERILMELVVNGVSMGGSVTTPIPRQLDAVIAGTGPLSLVEIRKGDQIICRKQYFNKLGESNLLKVAFTSTSDVVGHDNPRGYMIWRGWIEFGREQIDSIDSTKLFNWQAEYAKIDVTNSRRVNFEVHTRGHTNSFFIQLSELRADDEMQVHLDETVEVADSRYIRARDVLSERNIAFSAKELLNGRARREIITGDSKDSISLELIDMNSPWDVDFTIEDNTSDDKEGCHYFLYVEQHDGAQAWSSAIKIESTR